MAQHVLDGEPPPEYLRRAWMYKAWHADVLRLPIGELEKMNSSLNAYNALDGWAKTKAEARIEWQEKHPEAWAFVSGIVAERLKRKRVSNGSR